MASFGSPFRGTGFRINQAGSTGGWGRPPSTPAPMEEPNQGSDQMRAQPQMRPMGGSSFRMDPPQMGSPDYANALKRFNPLPYFRR